MKTDPRKSLLVLIASGMAALAIWLVATPATDAGQVYVMGGDKETVEDSDAAFLGVSLEEETEHPEGGARVTQVVEGSPADKAGLREGDVIQRFDGEAIRGPVSLTERIHDHEPGARVSIKLVRDGDERQIEVELGEREDYSVRGHGQVHEIPLDAEKLKEWAERYSEEWRDGEQFERMAPRAFMLGHERPRLGVQLAETTPELRSHFGGSEDAGVLVSKVLEGMPAEEAGFRVGDLIVAVDGEPVASVGELSRALQDHDGEMLKIEVVRDRQKRTLEVTLPAREQRERPTGPRAHLATPHPPAPMMIRVPPAMPAPPAPPTPPAAPAPLAPPPTPVVARVDRWV